MTDEKRLDRAIRSPRKDESKRTFQLLYEKYRPLVSLIAARYLRESVDVEDVVQETFVQFFGHAQNVRTSVKAYLVSTAKNLSLNLLSTRRRVVLSEEVVTQEEPPANEGFEALLSDLKRVLSEEDVRIILLRLIEDLTFEEIAARLRQNERTVKTKYYRALKKYRAAGRGEK